MIYLDKEDIVFINYKTIEVHGGSFTPPYNILKEQPLDYVVDIVKAEMFGASIYPLISDKAAVYFFTITCGHIFGDGNKRTGVEAALSFLKLNGWRLRIDLPHSELFNFVIKVASGESSLEECREWFKENIMAM